MNTVKKISTLFALALISQSSFASDTTPSDTTPDTFEGIAVNAPLDVAYTPNDVNITANDNMRLALQNILQSASVSNDTDLTNNMTLTDLYNSDIMKSITSNTNAMNSNTGSSYNDSTNTIDTTSDDSSTNTFTTTTDSSRSVGPLPSNSPTQE